jgi:transposase InsO family protein
VFTDSKFMKVCEQYGIKRHFTVHKTPQHNGVAERMNRTIVEKTRCLKLNARFVKNFWAEAMNMTCFLINRSPRATLDRKVAEKLWTSTSVNYSSDERSKFNTKSRQYIFLGIRKE